MPFPLSQITIGKEPAGEDIGGGMFVPQVSIFSGTLPTALTGDVTVGTNTITNVSSLSGVIPGNVIRGNGIPLGALVVSASAGTITFSGPAATASGLGVTLACEAPTNSSGYNAVRRVAIGITSPTSFKLVSRYERIDPLTFAAVGSPWLDASGVPFVGSVQDGCEAKTETITHPLTSPGPDAFVNTFAYDDIDIYNDGASNCTVSITGYGSFVCPPGVTSPELGDDYFSDCSITGVAGSVVTVQFSRHGRI
jgi:hypothetical protein